MSALQRAVASATNIGISCMGQAVGANEISVEESKLAGVSSFLLLFCQCCSVLVLCLNVYRYCVLFFRRESPLHCRCLCSSGAIRR